MKQGPEIGLAEVCTDTHVPGDCSRGAWREALWRGVAASAVLLEDTLTAIR